MESAASPLIHSIDASTLTPIVRTALQRASFQVQDWQASELGGGAGNPVSLGLFRFKGSGQDQGTRLDWSVVLKVIQSPANVGWTNMGESDDQSHWNYWRRELLAYQSGLLLTLLPAGMAAPQCYAAAELPENVAYLWLEDIVDSYDGDWPLERYALLAYQIGLLNGRYLAANSRPAISWLGNHLVRQWIDLIPWRSIPWEHPRVLQRYPRPEENPFRRMLLENERFFDSLNKLPQTISHGDTYPTNFKSRDVNGDQTQTVALDWALMGMAPVGDDLGQLVFGTQQNLKDVNPEKIEQELFERYVTGLHDSGCSLEPQQIRFGYTASAALRVGLFQLFLLGEDLRHSAAGSAQVNEEKPSPRVACFEVARAAEAYQLLEIMK